MGMGSPSVKYFFEIKSSVYFKERSNNDAQTHCSNVCNCLEYGHRDGFHINKKDTALWCYIYMSV